jgi:VacB/RNase II family 3'-5' exoribonuclease
MSRPPIDLAEIARRALEERGFVPHPDPAAEAEAAELMPADGDGEPGLGTGAIRDLRQLAWFSIDNDDTRDLDQLSVAEALPGGAVRLRVAIADVDSRVRRGGAMDERAHAQTTSIYTPAGVFHMLPERVSTGLTSLHEGEDRLAVVVEFRVAAEAKAAVSEPEIYRARVHNHARLVYRRVDAFLEGRADDPGSAEPRILEQVRLHERAAGWLREQRMAEGALLLDTTAVRRGGRGLDPDDDSLHDRGRDLIEDLMLTANSAVATYLEKRDLPSLRRLVRTPWRWPRIVDLARAAGERLPAEPDPAALAGFLRSRRLADPNGFADLSLAVVKLLGSGEYVADLPGADAPGHFGLANGDYTHATAPNRRFPDLVTQRVLKAALAGAPCPYSPAEITAIAAHCTEREDAAAKVERQVQKAAAALLLEGRVGERFHGVVTGASDKGTWVRIFRPNVEGRVVRGERGLDVGDKVEVRLVGLDPGRGFIDFAR